MTEIEKKRSRLLAQHVMKMLQTRGFQVHYFDTKEEAVSGILNIIPKRSSITWGGSMTIRSMGLTEALSRGDYEVWDRDKAENPSEVREIYLKAFSLDWYLSSVNAISQDGVIVNIDGNGNRVAALTWGPKNVLFVVGINKITGDLPSALQRARSVAATTNSMRFDIDTPCQKDGICHSCHSKDCICNYFHFIRNSHPTGRHTVVLVGEALGY